MCFEFSSEIRDHCEQLISYKVQVDKGLAIKDTYRYEHEEFLSLFWKILVKRWIVKEVVHLN